MKNFNKIINIILISLAITIGVAFVLLYIIDKTNATNTLDYIVEILNKPLPIIGITTGAVLLFVWKFLKERLILIMILLKVTTYGLKMLKET